MVWPQLGVLQSFFGGPGGAVSGSRFVGSARVFGFGAAGEVEILIRRMRCELTRFGFLSKARVVIVIAYRRVSFR